MCWHTKKLNVNNATKLAGHTRMVKKEVLAVITAYWAYRDIVFPIDGQMSSTDVTDLVQTPSSENAEQLDTTMTDDHVDEVQIDLPSSPSVDQHPVSTTDHSYRPPSVAAPVYHQLVSTNDHSYRSPSVAAPSYHQHQDSTNDHSVAAPVYHQHQISTNDHSYRSPSLAAPVYHQHQISTNNHSYRPPSVAPPVYHQHQMSTNDHSYIPPSVAAPGYYQHPVSTTDHSYRPPSVSPPVYHQHPVSTTDYSYRPSSVSPPIYHQLVTQFQPSSSTIQYDNDYEAIVPDNVEDNASTPSPRRQKFNRMMNASKD